MSGYAAAAKLPDVARLFSDAEDSEAHGRWQVARTQYEEVLRELPGEEPVLIMRTIRLAARCLIEAGNLDAATDSLELARAAAVAFDDTGEIAHVMNLEGIVAQKRGDLAGAESLYRAARALAWRVNHTLLVAMLEQNLGTLANTRGNLTEARLRYEASLAAYMVLGMQPPQGPLHNNLGMLHTDLGEWTRAAEHFRQALECARECGDLAERLRVMANQAELCVKRRRFAKAKQLCKRVLALSLSPSACSGSWIAEAYKHLGVAHRETGAREDAERCLTSALAVAEQREDVLLTAEILHELAILHRAAGRHPETLSTLTRAHALFRQLSAKPDLGSVERQLRDLEMEFLEIVERWGESIESADSYTQGHCQRVAELATLLAADCGIPAESLLWFRMGALLHDVGKIVVPADILNKAGALTPAELDRMRRHPVAGEELVANANFPWDVRPMIRHHHERWDGTGYPDGLAGEAIPLTARILCVADVFDALTSTRSYRAAHSVDVAVAIMQSECGQTFDPAVLDVFVQTTLPRIRRRVWRTSQPVARLEGGRRRRTA
ncbi:MAG TPA: HD domain-containing phosphohydrolase [Gemmatimonadaceae bacterium]|nr:HD domain-containing phosphohydrolase [Gemmatimonadaceae bacterium]